MNDSEEGICCDSTCERWFHLRCSGLSQLEYDELGLDVNAKWACRKCSGTDKHLQLLPPRRTPHAFLLCRKTLLSNPKCWVLCTNPCMLSSYIHGMYFISNYFIPGFTISVSAKPALICILFCLLFLIFCNLLLLLH